MISKTIIPSKAGSSCSSNISRTSFYLESKLSIRRLSIWITHIIVKKNIKLAKQISSALRPGMQREKTGTELSFESLFALKPSRIPDAGQHLGSGSELLRNESFGLSIR